MTRIPLLRYSRDINRARSAVRPMTKISTQTICQLVACACVVLHSGCYLPVFNGPPGTIGAQRTRAVLNDPFPSDTLGPAFAGARPRGFDLPLSDTTTFQSHPSARRKRFHGPTGFFPNHCRLLPSSSSSRSRRAGVCQFIWSALFNDKPEASARGSKHRRLRLIVKRAAIFSRRLGLTRCG